MGQEERDQTAAVAGRGDTEEEDDDAAAAAESAAEGSTERAASYDGRQKRISVNLQRGGAVEG